MKSLSQGHQDLSVAKSSGVSWSHSLGSFLQVFTYLPSWNTRLATPSCWGTTEGYSSDLPSGDPSELIHRGVLLLLPPKTYNSGSIHYSPAYFYKSTQCLIPSDCSMETASQPLPTSKLALLKVICHIATCIRSCCLSNQNPRAHDIELQTRSTFVLWHMSPCLSFQPHLSPLLTNHSIPPHPRLSAKYRSAFPTLEQLTMFLPSMDGSFPSSESWCECHLLTKAFPHHLIWNDPTHHYPSSIRFYHITRFVPFLALIRNHCNTLSIYLFADGCPTGLQVPRGQGGCLLIPTYSVHILRSLAQLLAHSKCLTKTTWIHEWPAEWRKSKERL